MPLSSFALLGFVATLRTHPQYASVFGLFETQLFSITRPILTGPLHHTLVLMPLHHALIAHVSVLRTPVS